jgi:hypothetical protein
MISGVSEDASAASHFSARIPLPSGNASALFNTLIGSTQIGEGDGARAWDGRRGCRGLAAAA